MLIDLSTDEQKSRMSEVESDLLSDESIEDFSTIQGKTIEEKKSICNHAKEDEDQSQTTDIEQTEYFTDVNSIDTTACVKQKCMIALIYLYSNNTKNFKLQRSEISKKMIYY